MNNDNPIYNMCAAYVTLGCKLNFAETSSLRDTLMRQGVRPAEKGERADICVVNTCSVTDVADHKCRQAIHRLVKQHPGAYVVFDPRISGSLCSGDGLLCTAET